MAIFKNKIKAIKLNQISNKDLIDKAKMILGGHANHKELLNIQDETLRDINDRMHLMISKLQEDAYQEIILIEYSKRDKLYTALKFATNYLAAYTMKIDREKKFGSGSVRNENWLKSIEESDEKLGKLFRKLEKVPHIQK